MSERQPRPLVTISAAQQSIEARRAREAELMQLGWRRSWQRVFVQCVVLAFVGYLMFGITFAFRSGQQSELLSTSAFVVSYVLPFFRLVFLFVKHGDQF